MNPLDVSDYSSGAVGKFLCNLMKSIVEDERLKTLIEIRKKKLRLEQLFLSNLINVEAREIIAFLKNSDEIKILNSLQESSTKLDRISRILFDIKIKYSGNKEKKAHSLLNLVNFAKSKDIEDLKSIIAKEQEALGSDTEPLLTNRFLFFFQREKSMTYDFVSKLETYHFKELIEDTIQTLPLISSYDESLKSRLRTFFVSLDNIEETTREVFLNVTLTDKHLKKSLKGNEKKVLKKKEKLEKKHKIKIRGMDYLLSFDDPVDVLENLDAALSSFQGVCKYVNNILFSDEGLSKGVIGHAELPTGIMHLKSVDIGREYPVKDLT